MKPTTRHSLPSRSLWWICSFNPLLLGLLFTLVLASPAYARKHDVNNANNRAYRKASKKAQKGMRKYYKQQQKAQKKAAKAQRKALKRAQRNSAHY